VHITWKTRSLELLTPRSKTDTESEGARIGIPRGKVEQTCPVQTLQAWLLNAILMLASNGACVPCQDTLRASALSGEAVRLIVLTRAQLVGVEGSRLEPILPHGSRPGFVTAAYLNTVPNEKIMGQMRRSP
jgi:hypothetical protein